MEPRLTSSSPSFCLCLLSMGITPTTCHYRILPASPDYSRLQGASQSFRSRKIWIPLLPLCPVPPSSHISHAALVILVSLLASVPVPRALGSFAPYSQWLCLLPPCFHSFASLSQVTAPLPPFQVSLHLVTTSFLSSKLPSVLSSLDSLVSLHPQPNNGAITFFILLPLSLILCLLPHPIKLNLIVGIKYFPEENDELLLEILSYPSHSFSQFLRENQSLA